MNFLHVGYPKCASTLLQTQYFTPTNGFINLAEDPDWKIFIENQLLSAQSSYYFSQPPEFSIPENLKPCMVGLSSENFLDGVQLVDFKLALERWRALYPDTKVLIIIRKQDDLVYSHYIQYVRAGYFRGIDSYLREIMWNSQQSFWGRLYFDRIYEITRDIFDQVLVMPFEMISSFDQFIKTLNNFFGVSAETRNTIVRKSSSDLSHSMIRAMNIFLRYGYGKSHMSILASGVVMSNLYKFNDIDGIDPAERSIGRMRHKLINRLDRKFTMNFNNRQRFVNTYAQLFREKFSESNRRLEDTLQLELAKYKYPGM